MMKAIFNKLIDTVLAPLSFNIDFFGDMNGGLFTEITNTIYLGGRPDGNSVEELKKAGITHVVSCLDEKERSSVDFLGQDFYHLFLGVHDGMHENIAAKFPQLFDFTESVMDRHSNLKLFAHCEVGVSRSATLVIAQIMKTEMIGFFDVFKSMKSKRSQILPNIGFASQLQQLENDLLSENRINSPSSLALYLHHICNLPADIELTQSMLERYGFNAEEAIRSIFGGEIPRVVQGVKL
jgi:predicted protein tyrosine phosphatase